METASQPRVGWLFRYLGANMRNAWYEINAVLARFLSPAVRVIFLVNVLVTIVFSLVFIFNRDLATSILLFAEIPKQAIGRLFVWQFFTYMFVHLEVFHLLTNMLGLWFFAPRLEYTWGTRKFLSFYFVTGVGAGVLYALVTYVQFVMGWYALGYNPLGIAMLGASGAIYGVLLAYAMRWPDDIVLLYFVVPIKIKYLAIMLGVLAFLASISGGDPNISHVTHLGGLLVAYLYLKISDCTNNRRGPQRVRHPDFYR